MALGFLVWEQGLNLAPMVYSWAALNGPANQSWYVQFNYYHIIPVFYSAAILLGGLILLELGAIGMMAKGLMRSRELHGGK